MIVIVYFLIVLVFAGNVTVTVVLALPLILVTGGGVIVDVTVTSVGTTIVLVGAKLVTVTDTAVDASTVDVQRSGVLFAIALGGDGRTSSLLPKKRLPQPAWTRPRLVPAREEGVFFAARSDLTRDGVQVACGSERGVTPAQVVVWVVVVREKDHLVCVIVQVEVEVVVTRAGVLVEVKLGGSARSADKEGHCVKEEVVGMTRMRLRGCGRRHGDRDCWNGRRIGSSIGGGHHCGGS